MIRRIAVNLIMIIAAFIIQTCVFPKFDFLSATPNLLLILIFTQGFIRGKEAGMFYGLLAGLLMDLFVSGPFGFYTLFLYQYGLFKRHMHEILLRGLHHAASDLKYFQQPGLQHVYLHLPGSC